MAKKETKKVYTVNLKPTIHTRALVQAEKNKRSFSAHVEMLLEADINKSK